MIGKTLGPYKILEALGAGGMGEVYLGEDTRLGRKVAIKVLPAEFAADPERLARFEQEARAAAALNHPHIAAVYDVGFEPGAGSDPSGEVAGTGDTTKTNTGVGVHYMVQEYLKGDSLRQRLDKGSMPLDRALALVTEVGEALVAAHKAGIVHRDLKPDNIFVTEEGHAKVLDFGLAKLTEPVNPVGSGMSQSPTMLGTVAGQIMGTAGYMAPEQVVGDAEVDHRADIFSFGLLIYEATAGKQAFSGRSVMQTLDLIINEEPEPLTSINPSLPPELQRIVRKAMAKDRDRRYQSAVEIAVDLKQLQEDIAAGVTGGMATSPAPTSRGSSAAFPWKFVAPAAVGVLVIGYLLGSVVGPSDPPPTSAAAVGEPTRFTIPVDSGHTMKSGYFSQLAVSSDGRMVVYAADNLLWLRALDGDAARPLEGTEGAEQPFFSSLGDWIAFNRDNLLMRYRLADGSVSQFADAIVGQIAGGSWGEDNSIIVGMVTQGLNRVGVGDSELEQLIAPVAEQGETAYVSPQSVDGGRAVIYTALGPSFVAKDAEIVIYDIAADERTVIVERGTHGRYVPTGHIVYVDSVGTLMAVPFDLERRQVASVAAEPVEVGIRIAFWAGAASFDVSSGGTLVFARGSNWENQIIAVVDRSGAIVQRIGRPLTTDDIKLSRDGSTIAVDRFGPDTSDIYTYDLDGGSVRFTRDDAMEENGVPSPNGDRVAYMRTSAGNLGQIFVQGTEQGSEPKVVYQGPQYELPQTWSPDGRYLVISASDDGGLGDVLAIDMDNVDQEPIGIATTERNETPGDFSDDGDYYAFEVEDHVTVVPFPGLDRNVEIQNAKTPRWTAEELFFVRGSKLMAVPISTEPSFQLLGEPEELFDLPALLTASRPTSIWPFPDGQRFLIDLPNPDADARTNEIWVVVNWLEELKRLAPTGGSR